MAVDLRAVRGWVDFKGNDSSFPLHVHPSLASAAWVARVAGTAMRRVQQDHESRNSIFGKAAMSGVRRRTPSNPLPWRAARPENPCTNSQRKARSPSPDTNVHSTPRRWSADCPCRSSMGVTRPQGPLSALPSADTSQSHPHQRQKAGNDEKELQHLVIDGTGQPAEQNIHEHDETNATMACETSKTRRVRPAGAGHPECGESESAWHGIHGNTRRENGHDGE